MPKMFKALYHLNMSLEALQDGEKNKTLSFVVEIALLKMFHFILLM